MEAKRVAVRLVRRKRRREAGCEPRRRVVAGILATRRRGRAKVKRIRNHPLAASRGSRAT
jgi:hypothetical protein